MSNDDKDYPHSGSGMEEEPEDDSPGSTAPRPSRQEPRFSDFDPDDDYEEPDRDTDYTSFYGEDEPVEEFDEAADDTDREENGRTASTWSFDEPPAEDEWDEEDQVAHHDEPAREGSDRSSPSATSDTSYREQPDEDDYTLGWEEEELAEENGSGLQQWPLGMISVGVIALLLLTAGGYGIIQQRSAMEEEIRQLQATLAMSASPEEVADSRAALAEVEQRNAELQANLDVLVVYNKELTDTVAGLEAQLQARQASVQQAAAAPPATGPDKPADTSPPASAAGDSGWFVNFGSYNRRDMAESWVEKLDPGAGRVVVSTGSVEGKTLYRVRVVDLDNREQAESIARKLETEYGLARLWVGKQ